MKKIFGGLCLLTAMSLCMSGCSLVPAALDVNNPKYYCPETADDSSYSFTDLYVPSDDCSMYKAFSESAYDGCIERNNNLKTRYDSGKCENVVVKKHNISGSKCTVEITEKSNHVISKSCFGNNTDKAMKKLQEIYK